MTLEELPLRLRPSAGAQRRPEHAGKVSGEREWGGLQDPRLPALPLGLLALRSTSGLVWDFTLKSQRNRLRIGKWPGWMLDTWPQGLTPKTLK